MGTYPVYMSSLCIYRTYELIKFKKSKKIIHVLSILLHIHIKFRVQIPNNEEAVKRTKFLTYLKLEIYQKFLFLL
jgi:hypothetical protein